MNKVIYKITDGKQLPLPVGVINYGADGIERCKKILQPIFDSVYGMTSQDWSRFETERIIVIHGGSYVEDDIEVRVLGNIPYHMIFETLDSFWYEGGMVAAVGAEFAKMEQVF